MSKKFNKVMHYNDIENAYTRHQYPDAECMLTDTNDVPDSLFTVDGVKLIPKKVTENGTYYASQDGANGYDEVIVDVEGHAEPVLEHLVCNYNGTFLPEEGVDGFDVVTTNIHPSAPYVGNFTSNQSIFVSGEYNGVDITVNVQPRLEDKNITANGTYSAGADYDGLGEVVVNVPPTYVGNTIKYLCYASFTGTDPATTSYNYPLDIKSYGGYDDYLTYDTNTNEIVVKKDFTAVIMLWCINYNTATHPAIMGLKLNGNWFISPIRATDVSIDSIGTINTSFKSLDSKEGSGVQTYIPDKSNCILLPLHTGDRLSIQKPFDHGWLHAYIKIYKLFDSTSSTDSFMNSVITASDTSNYVNINAGGSLTLDTLTAVQNGQYTPTHDGYQSVTVNVPPTHNPYNATNLLVADEGQYITNDFEIPLVSSKVYVGEIYDVSRGELVPFLFTRYVSTSQDITLRLANEIAILTITNTTASLTNYAGSFRKVYLRLSEVVDGQLY